MNGKYEERLGTDRMLPLIFRMALPAIVAQLVNLLYSIVDRIYIGHIEGIGTDALTGIGVSGSMILLISAFSAIVGGGGAPLAAIALGRGDRERAGRILGNGFVLLIIFTAVTSAISYIFMEPILLATGASGNTIKYAVEYLSVYLIGTLFVQLATGLNPYINVQGRPGIAMTSVIIGAALNIVLDPIFIFLFGLNVKGAAIATVIAQACSALWILLFLRSNRASLKLETRFMHPDFRVLGSIFALGISPFIMSATESVVGFVLNGSLEKHGDIYVGALTVMQSLMQIVSVPLSGFSQGFVPVISYNYGHNSPGRVKQGFKIVLPVMFSFNFLLMLLLILFPAQASSLFTDDKELIKTVSRVLPVFLSGMTVFGLQRACQNMFIALGQAKVSLFIAILRKLILLVPLALILPRFMGVMGIYAAEGIADATAATCCTLIFAFRFPKILAALPPKNGSRK